MPERLLEWLQSWYERQCDGDWEQTHGVTAQSLDNPGWAVTVDLEGTAYEAFSEDKLLAVSGEPPSASNGNVGGSKWMTCELKNKKFEGAGDPTKLEHILECLRAWVHTCDEALGRPSLE